MKFDVFFSICQTDVDGELPDERTMYQNFFEQVRLADELGYGVAWVAETHLSTETQKRNAHPVIPHFRGEIGLNTDIFQLAHKIFGMTRQIEVGSAICNLLCNGGPLARAEALKTFLSLHAYAQPDQRRLHFGFASGRFDFSNTPYGIAPRSPWEEIAWKAIKGKVLIQATEIFLRALKERSFSSKDLAPMVLKASDFRSEDDWQTARTAYRQERPQSELQEELVIAPFWTFEEIGVIPFEAPLNLVNLVLGSHDPHLQKRANELMPVSVFNLSITPPEVIEQTHRRMQQCFHPDGGPWQRHYMPRTCMVFIDDTPGLSDNEKQDRARAQAEKAWQNYWRAMEGTIDDQKVQQAVRNSVAGDPGTVAKLLKEKYHPEDRLMLWFDFNNHDNQAVQESMRVFMQKVAPQLS